jgi:protease IV
VRLAQRLAACLAIVTLLGSCEGKDKPESGANTKVEPGDDRLAVFDLSNPLLETLTGGGFLPTPASHTYAGFLGTLRDSKRNEHVKGFFLRLGNGTDNWAHVEELGREFKAVRAEGRPIYCHADQLDNAGLWLAAASCDKIWLSPAGTVDSVGLAGQNLYMKGLLDRLKVKADFLHAGRYKSAAESLTRDGPSPEAEEAMRAVLSSMRAAWLEGIAANRSDPKAKEAAETGPWFPNAARAIGLVDEVGYESDARTALETKSGVKAFVAADQAQKEAEAASAIAEVVRTIAGGGASFDEPHVAILPAAGGISMEPSGTFEQTGIVAETFIRLIRRLKREDATKAVVLRIDSPGGSALASDLLWHELEQLAEKKPLIVSVGSMAASGGYYMAVAGRKIVAEKTSIVGSIGVVGGKFVLNDALAEYGVSTHTFAASDVPDAGARAAYLSPFVEWDEATRGRVQDQMENVYALFLDRVAQGRGMPVEEVRHVAEGRIWTGQQGLERKLVDQIGGLRDSLSLARTEAGLPEDAPSTIEGDVESLLDLLGLGEPPDEGELRAAWERKLRALPGVWSDLPAEYRSHAQSLWPLVEGERVVLAMDGALVVD